jgi:hypothetical protein
LGVVVVFLIATLKIIRGFSIKDISGGGGGGGGGAVLIT